MKIQHIHAHFDDFELVAAGTFEMWRQKLGDEVRRQIVVCGDGKAGHHFRSREEIAQLRLQEQLASARLAGVEFHPLRLHGGKMPREACLAPTTDFLAALWKTIRDFEPDYLFCPPLPGDTLAGIHNDHIAVADAVRRVAYMVNVPHAYSLEYPPMDNAALPVRTPVILNVYDSYQFGANRHDLAIDIEDAFDLIAEMAWCHQSQITEWLPWVNRHGIDKPESLDDWKRQLRAQLVRRNRELDIKGDRLIEVFTVTAWGVIPTFEQITRDFPSIVPEASNLEQFQHKLDRWHGRPAE